MTAYFSLQPDRRHPIYRDGQHVASFVVGVTAAQREQVMVEHFGRVVEVERKGRYVGSDGNERRVKRGRKSR